MRTPQLVIFTHVPKVAGTSIMRQLIQPNYSPEEIKVYRGERDLLCSRGGFRILTGHSTWGVQYLTGGDARLFTMLREPVERAISHYFFIKQPFLKEGRHGNRKQHRLHNETPLAEIFERNSRRKWRLSGTWLVDNMQTRYLAGYEHYWKPVDSASLLQAAKHNLEHRYAVFGLQSHFDESVSHIAQTFDWRIGENTKRAKATNIKKDVTDADRADVARWNMLDQDLYDFAQELFRKRGMP